MVHGIRSVPEISGLLLVERRYDNQVVAIPRRRQPKDPTMPASILDMMASRLQLPEGTSAPDAAVMMRFSWLRDRWYLATNGQAEWLTDDLEKLEALLYAFAVDEEYV